MRVLVDDVMRCSVLQDGAALGERQSCLHQLQLVRLHNRCVDDVIIPPHVFFFCMFSPVCGSAKASKKVAFVNSVAKLL